MPPDEPALTGTPRTRETPPLARVLARFGRVGSPVGTRRADSVPIVVPPVGAGEIDGTELTQVNGAEWDAGAAESALRVLREAVQRAERERFGGQFPPAVAAVLAVWLEVGEGYIRDQSALRTRGWDPLKSLKKLPSAVAETVANWERLCRRRTLAPGEKLQ